MPRYLTSQLRVRLDPEVHAELIRRAEEDRRPVGAVVRDAIRAHLKKGKRSQ